MSGSVKLRKGEFEGVQFLRWVLMLIIASRAAGIRELDRGRLHALLFQSFASSLFYGIKPLRQRAQRTSHGPYYRAAHIAVGKLVLSGLVSLEDYRPLDHKRDIQFDGRLFPTADGLKVVHALRETQTGDRIYRFLIDLCLGTVQAVHIEEDKASSEDESEPEALEQLEVFAQANIDRILSTDLSYQQARKKNDKLLPIVDSPDGKPLTVRGLEDVEGAFDDSKNINRRDVLMAYQYLLSRRVA